MRWGRGGTTDSLVVFMAGGRLGSVVSPVAESRADSPRLPPTPGYFLLRVICCHAQRRRCQENAKEGGDRGDNFIACHFSEPPTPYLAVLCHTLEMAVSRERVVDMEAVGKEKTGGSGSVYASHSSSHFGL